MNQVSGFETATSPPTARGRATRQSLLDAAEEVFGEFSYERASISEITRRAGVGQGTFYVYFPDKKAAFVELVRYLNHSLRESIAIAVADLDDRLEIERVGFRAYFDYIRGHRPLYRIVREAEFVAPEVHRWHYDTLAKGYVRGLEHAQAAGQILVGLEPETIANLLMGVAEFVGGRYLLRQGADLSDEVYEQVLAFVGRGLGYQLEESA